jgi:HD-like signal output (HDOD) protein/ActR/RegA family two-component response regulator
MAFVMIISEHERETQILKLAFEQKNISVKMSTPEYQNFIKIQQFVPDILLLELPKVSHSQLHFAELIKRHKKTKQIPIISYGDTLDEATKKGLINKGIFKYIDRPLKFSVLLEIIAVNLKKQNKEIGTHKTPVSDKEKDIELLLNKETLGSKKIEIMVDYVSGLMAFPFTVAKVLQLAESEKSAAGDLAKVIQADPVISAQLLKISNSVLFASLNRRIASVKDAIIRVGFRETKRLVMSMSVMTLFSDQNKNLGFDRTDFWYHSLVCGIISERLAKQIGTLSAEEAFLAGILHDFGILLLDEFFPAIFSKALEETVDKGQQFIKSEKALLGVTHNDMLAELFTKWKLPESISDGIVHQYRFSEYKNNLDTPAKKIALCVGMSDILAKTASLGRECDQFVMPIENWAFDAVKMPAGFTAGLLDDISNQMKLYGQFLKLDNKKSAVDPEAAKIKIGVANPAKSIFVPPLTYLQKEGYAATPLVRLDALKNYNGALHCIFLWANETASVETILQFANITKVSDPPSGESAPLVVFIDEKSAHLTKKEELSKISFISKSFDLRHLDANISSIIDGKVTRVLQFSDAQKENAPAPPQKNDIKEEPVQKPQADEVAADAKDRIPDATPKTSQTNENAVKKAVAPTPPAQAPKK